MKTVLVGLLILIFCAVAVGQNSNHNAGNSGVIHGSGCVAKAVETSCRVLIDTKSGDTYNLLFGSKAPKSGTAIRFKGRVHQGMTTCMQGKPVNVSSWKKEKGIKCPAPPEPAH